MRFNLTAEVNNDTGELGWKDSRLKGECFGPMDYSYGLSHDCLEHFAFDGVADEIEAHGAMYWLRYEGGWSHPKFGHTLDMEGFANEWISLVRGIYAEPYLPTPRKTRPLDSVIEDDISEIIEKGKKAVRSEFGSDEDSPESDTAGIEQVFRAYFRIGYRKAAKRYKGHAACEIAGLYNTLADAFERNKPECEGQQIVVTVNLKTGRVSVDENDLVLDY
jgi:hypothetical protein